jgi:hypothetical protein
MLLFTDEPCDQFVSHDGGGRPLASSERRVQVSEPWIESRFSAGRQRTAPRFVLIFLSGRMNLGLETPGFKVRNATTRGRFATSGSMAFRCSPSRRNWPTYPARFSNSSLRAD